MWISWALDLQNQEFFTRLSTATVHSILPSADKRHYVKQKRKKLTTMLLIIKQQHNQKGHPSIFLERAEGPAKAPQSSHALPWDSLED